MQALLFDAFPLIAKSLLLTGLLFQNKTAHADIRTPTSQPPTPLSGNPKPTRPTGVGLRRDKPMVGLHQHTRLSKATRVTDSHSSGAQGEWAGTWCVCGWWWGGLLRHWQAANLAPASLLMPTICVCKSSPVSQKPPQQHLLKRLSLHLVNHR